MHSRIITLLRNVFGEQSNNRRTIVHNIALLRRLTKKQLEFVILLDPCMRGNHIRADEMMKQLALVNIDPDTTKELIRSWAEQLDQMCRGKAIVFGYYRKFDELTGTTHLGRDYAIRLGLFNFLSTCGSEIKWYHMAEAATRALKKNDLENAYKCFAQLHTQNETIPARRRSVKGLTRVLHQAIKYMNFTVIDECLH